MSASRVRAGGAYVELLLDDKKFGKGLKRSERLMQRWVQSQKKELEAMERVVQQRMARIQKALTQQLPKGLMAVSNQFGKLSNVAVKTGSKIGSSIRDIGDKMDGVLKRSLGIVSFERVQKAIGTIQHSVMQLGASMRRSGFDLLFGGGAVVFTLGSTLRDLTQLDEILSSIRGTMPMSKTE